MEKLEDVIRALESIVAAFAPELIDTDQATRLVETFTKGERLCAAGRALAARRVQNTHGWKHEGFRSAADWLAAKAKTSAGTASETLNMAEQIESHPATRQALVSGQISAEQAAAITSAASVDPGSEGRLLQEAERSSLRRLQREAHAARVAACREQASQRERIHATRYVRTWTSADGAFEGRFRLTPDHGAIVEAALDIERAAVFAAARSDGRYEPSQAYAADALVNLARTTVEVHEDGGQVDRDPPPQDPAVPGLVQRSRRPATWPHAVLNIRVDYGALRRGFTEPGEICEITNHGAITPEAARHAAEDAFIRLHLYDRERLIDVANPGRNISTAMRYGLEQRDRTCCVPGCDVTRHLEIHHLHGVTLGGKASLDNLCRICPRHHDQITHDGARLTGRPGHWVWRPPMGSFARSG